MSSSTIKWLGTEELWDTLKESYCVNKLITINHINTTIRSRAGDVTVTSVKLEQGTYITYTQFPLEC